MYDAYKKIFWGIYIATFSINIGIIKILPAFIGFMMISSGISSLYTESKIESFNKAKIFANIMVTMSFIGQFIERLLANALILNGIWVVLFGVIEIIMIYNYLDGVTHYFNTNNHEELANKNIEDARFYLIGSITNIVALNLALIFNIYALQFISALILIMIRIYLMSLTNRFKKLNCFAEGSGNNEAFE